MFDKILIANRGEIACRVIRTARDLGLKTVAVYSEADAAAPHVKLADDAVCIGAAPVAESYLQAGRIIEAAQAKGAGAIHPGYGFLSENAEFAQAVADAGLVFIGAPAGAIDAMGNKAGAKRLMINAEVPCVPGYEDADQSKAAFEKAAEKIGYPLMIKAAAGGGGRGMRIITDPKDLSDGIDLAKSEAENAFGSGELILEKAVQNPRHVEVQVFADAHGSVIHLGERDCSVQRRHQKVFEEAPCPVMTPELREAMTTAAINAARAVDYRGAGTVEFLLDSSGEFYFLEMNTRLQVEHPVTELITGLDLVELQILVAQGKPLPVTQDDVRLTGHAIEARLYAEDPAQDFMPTVGPILLWQPAEGAGIRVDDGIETGGEVSPFYDSMLAKVMAYAPTREAAAQRLKAGLEHTSLLGLNTNRAFLIDALGQDGFYSDDLSTAFIAETYPDGVTNTALDASDWALAAALVHHRESTAHFDVSALESEEMIGWSSAAPLPHVVALSQGEDEKQVNVFAYPDTLKITVPDEEEQVSIQVVAMSQTDATLQVGDAREAVSYAIADGQVWLRRGADDRAFTVIDPMASGSEDGGDDRIVAPMPGLVISIDVAAGDKVEKDQTLAVLEAMKMQHQIRAARDGVVAEVAVNAGDQLTAGALMIELEVEK